VQEPVQEPVQLEQHVLLLHHGALHRAYLEVVGWEVQVQEPVQEPVQLEQHVLLLHHGALHRAYLEVVGWEVQVLVEEPVRCVQVQDVLG